jgi:signal transduction histidine kinase
LSAAFPALTIPRGRTFPLLSLAPVVVLVVGLLVAVALGALGLDQLVRTGSEGAQVRADEIAQVLSVRLSALPRTSQAELLELAARRTAVELFVVTDDGRLQKSASLSPPSIDARKRMVVQQKGTVVTRFGPSRFSVTPPIAALSGGRLVVVVREPPAEGAPALLSALAALFTLLMSVAALVAYAVVLDAGRDVDYVKERVLTMAATRVDPSGEPVPVRTLDEVGVLSGEFNALVDRFSAAEKAYNEDLVRARAGDRDRAAFLAAVSHELRSPLNAILGFADILLTEVDGPLTDSAREEAEQIKGSGEHLHALINDILEFSALESGQLKLTRMSMDLSAVAQEVVREAAVLVKDRPLSVRIQAEPNVILNADARRVRQVMQNLVGNAVKFTQQGEVNVRVVRDGAYARLFVSDTGPGISAAERAVIFEDYKQASDEKKRRRGTGLGLAIARRLVLMHGGDIQVESELGRGSTFAVRFPLASKPVHGGRT